MDDIADWSDNGNPENKVANGPIHDTPRSVGIGGDFSTDSRTFYIKWVKGEKEVLFRQLLLQLIINHAGLYLCGEIAGFKLHNPAHVFQAEHGICCFQARPDVLFGATSPRHKCNS